MGKYLLLPCPLRRPNLQQALQLANVLPCPDFVIARKQKYYWRIRNRIFDYQGRYRKANELK